MEPILIDITIPEYAAGREPDHAVVGTKLDEVLKQYFMGKRVVVRCVGSQDHPELTLDDLADIIVQFGTDKYDPKRMGVGYDEFHGTQRQVDFYGEDAEITNKTAIMSQAIWEMHHSAVGDRGFSVHVDLILVYDAAQLNMVMNLYSHHPTSDGFVFKDSANKKAALLGVIKIR